MAIVSEEIINKDIKNKTLSKVYLLFGNDSYLVSLYTDRISEIACTGDPFFNLQKFEGSSDLQEVYDAVKQYPMMADSKCVILSDFDYLKCDKTDMQRLENIINETEYGCVLVLRFETVLFDIKKESRSKKLVSAIEKVGGKVVCLNHRSRPQLAKMLIKGAVERGCNLSDNDAKYIIDLAGEDINILKNELDKLCAFAGSGDIRRETINYVSVKSVDASVYDFVSLIISGNTTAALKLLDDMFFMRIEPMVILYSVSSVYIDMYRVYTANKMGIGINRIAEDFDYKARAFVLQKVTNNLKRFDFKKLNESFETLLKTDKALKSFGGDEQQILEKMTITLIYIIWGEK